MDYYDELNIDQNASESDVQKSYRRLTRLMHPDLHPEPELKALAEKQMLRLQQIAGILGDPGKRREYDASLRGTAAPLLRYAPGRDRLPWVIVGFILGLTAYYLAMAGGRHRDPLVIAAGVEEPAEPSDKDKPKSDRPPRLRQKSSPTPPEIPAEPETARQDVQPPPLAESPPAAAGPAPLPPAAARPEMEVCAGCEPASLAGSWLYVSSKERGETALYPPEYIEMRVAQQDGWLRGTYRARYRVADRPIAPDMAFDFRGWAPESEAVFPWTGAGGLKGEVTLKPLTRSSVEVSWHVTEFGGQSVLGAGTAVLIRRAD